jgi:hypothetical protein
LALKLAKAFLWAKPCQLSPNFSFTQFLILSQTSFSESQLQRKFKVRSLTFCFISSFKWGPGLFIDRQITFETIVSDFT